MELDNLIKDLGIPTPELEIAGTSFQYYQHAPGEYVGRIGKFEIAYKDAEGKKVTADAIGAVQQNYGQLDIIITNSPDGHGYNPNKPVTEASYGELIFKQYIPLDPDKQFQNKGLFDGLVYANVPGSAVIEEIDNKNFKVKLGNLALFYGASVRFRFKQGKKSVYLIDMLLTDPVITKEKLAKYKSEMDKIYDYLAKVREREEMERNKNKDEVQKILPKADVSELDSIMDTPEGDYE